MLRQRALVLILCAVGVFIAEPRDATARFRFRRCRRVWQCCSQPKTTIATAEKQQQVAEKQLHVKELTAADIPLDASPKIRKLIAATLSNDYEVQHTAIQELGGMGERAAPAVPFLVQILAKKDSGLLQIWAIDALNKIGPPAAAPMIAEIGKQSEESRCNMISLLAQCKNWEIRKSVLPFFHDPDPKIRRAAVGSLYMHADSRLIPPILGSMKDPDADVRKEAIHYFVEYPTPAAVEPLLALVKAQDPSVRELAISALSGSDDRRLVPILIDILQNANETAGVRWHAAFGLSLSGDKRAAGPFLAILKDRQQPDAVRAMATQGLGALRDLRAVEPLIAVLKDTGEPNGVRVSAAEALSELADQRALAPLAQFAKADGDPALKFWCAIGTVELTGGAIDDIRIVDAVRNYHFVTFGAGPEDRALPRSLKMIAENGKTDSIRSAAAH